MSSDRENPEQIPSRENIGETKATVSEQGGVSGERKEVDVKDYPKAAAMGQILKNLDFPADKKKIIAELWQISFHLCVNTPLLQTN